MHTDRLAMVAGATGVAGRTLVDRLVSEGWNILAISRRIEPDPRPQVTAIPVDIGDADAVSEALHAHRVTHLFYAVQYRDRLARASTVTDLKKLRKQLALVGRCMPLLRWIPGARGALYRKVAMEAGSGDPTKRNLHFFRTLIETLETSPHALQHVALVTGGKHYGMHLGPDLYPDYTSTYVEDQPRSPGPNWYYDLEDYIASHSPSWSWSVFRPSFIIGYAHDAPYNFGTTLAVYAALRKARGEPLIFFGDARNRAQLWDISSAHHMADMMIESTTLEQSHGEAFNCTTGVPFSWEQVWPEMARWFGIEAQFNDEAFPVRPFFEANEGLWQELVQQHDLQPSSLLSLSSDDFVDRAMAMDWDACYSMEKANKTGFSRTVTPAKVFTNLFDQLAQAKVIPSPSEHSGQK